MNKHTLHETIGSMKKFELISLLANAHYDVQDALDEMARKLGVTRTRRPFTIHISTLWTLEFSDIRLKYRMFGAVGLETFTECLAKWDQDRRAACQAGSN